MAISYFGENKYWKNITREERLFCSHLYHKMIEPGNTKRFVEWLNSIKSPVADFTNTIKLNPDANWESAFEVCFYRDLLKANGYRVKENLEKLKTNKHIGEEAINLIKRTFDLALFSENTIVIIEAKAAQRLTSTQFKEFETDENLIRGVFEFLNLKMPEIVFIILAADSYYQSDSFRSPKGVGKVNLIDKAKTNKCKVHGLISWKQLFDSSEFNDENFLRAENVYKK